MNNNNNNSKQKKSSEEKDANVNSPKKESEFRTDFIAEFLKSNTVNSPKKESGFWGDFKADFFKLPLIGKLIRDYIQKCYARAIFKSILYLSIFAIFIWVFISYFKVIAITAAIIIAIAGLLWNQYNKLKEDERTRREQTINKSSTSLKVAITPADEDNYILIRQIIFIVIREIGAAFNIIIPTVVSEIDSTLRIIKKNGITIFEFAVIKSGGEVAFDTFKDVLKNRINQKLRNNELPISPPTFIYNGQTKPILLVDEVEDMGAYFHINIVFASNKYFEYAEMKKYNNINNVRNTVNKNDVDF